jgi:glutathione S-transferase
MLRLYGIDLSTFTRKVRLALAEKGIEYRLEPAPMHSPRVRALHPLGKIPVIEHDGIVVPDSSVIIAYLERVWPGVPLYPAEPRALARALWLEEYADTRLREATLPWFAERVVKPLFQGRSADETTLDRAAALRDETLAYLERELAGGDFAVGSELSVADVAIGAQLVTYVQGSGELSATLARYLAALSARPAWAPLLAGEHASLAAAERRRAAPRPS